MKNQRRLAGALRGRRCRLIACWGGALAALALWPLVAVAAEEPQQPTPDAVPAQAAPEKAAPETVVPAAASPDAAADSAKPINLGQHGEKPVGDAEQLSFRQEKVAAEMTELEQRMFRLAEGLKALEPANASRLMLGLKYAREELILHEMKETQTRLAKLSLGDAVTEQKQLLAKLQRLQDLLLSSDLDFQLRLERLRQIRELIRRLDTAIKEEDRELGRSGDSFEKEQRLAGLRKRRATVEELVREQTGHVESGTKLVEANDPAAGQNASAELIRDQESTHKKTQTLAAETAEPDKGEANLSDASTGMASAVELLGQSQPKDALPRQQQALDALQKELDRVAKAEKRLARQLSEAKFAAMRKDQVGNHKLTDGISDGVRQLGESGAGALEELIRAGGSMSDAEGDLGQCDASSAGQQQERALQSLKYAQNQLSEEAKRLLEELRAEVKKRVLEGLTLMLEKQVAVRETTVVLQPRWKKGARQALSSLAGLAASEGKIVEVDNELISLVEETEFGIALPAALESVRDAMIGVKTSLASADASDAVIDSEKQIEADLKEMLEAMKRIPSSGGSGPPKKGDLADRERELNRLVAELKMIRMLQQRLNRDTVDVDSRRPQELEALSKSIRQQIDVLQGRQDNVRGVTEKLGAQRGH